MAVTARDPALLELRGRFFLCDAQADAALSHARGCLAAAGDSRNCTRLQRAARAFADGRRRAQALIAAGDFAAAEAAAAQCDADARRLCPPGSQIFAVVNGLSVKSLLAQGKSAQALERLNELIAHAPNSSELLLERAAILEKDRDLDGAMRDYQAVRRVDPRNKRAEEGIQKISKLQEKEKNVDFYEVLGVKKGCSEADIKSAYKAQARKWHPDRVSDPAKKRNAERMMKNLNRAYDVLADRDKRRLYDQGVDPDTGMPPGGGPGGPGGQHFHQGGFPGGFQGGFHFDGGGQEEIIRQMFGGRGGGGGRRVHFHFG
jgi:tetratricopeptide (TPR) repeat protein